MAQIENSPQLWNKLWAQNPACFSISRPIDSFLRRIFYFSAFDDLLNSFSLSNKDILELGSGTGNHSLYFAKRHLVRSITLLDFSETILAKVDAARFPCPVIKLQQDILTFNPYAQYDFVHSAGLVEHFTEEQRLRVIQIHADCAKRGGFVMIWVPVRSPAFSVIGQFNRWTGIQEIPFTEEELKNLAAQSGLKIIRENHSAGGAIFGILAQKPYV